MVIAELESGEKDRFVEKLSRRVDSTKMLWQNPFKFNFKLLGAITGLDFSVKSAASIAQIFEEECFYFFSQNLLDQSKNAVLKVPASAQTEDCLPSEYSYYWASEFLLATGSKTVWFILFNAELSVGILVVDADVDSTTRDVVKNTFKQYEILSDPTDVFKEFCLEFARYGDIKQIESDFKSFINRGS